MWKYSLTIKEMGSNHQFYFDNFSSLDQKNKNPKRLIQRTIEEKMFFNGQILSNFSCG